ncbi:MAG: hypothetical protein JSW59_06765 [Phycisphaerales bacterium]|nr:MAG: hypothetical protein JSW59_06765 [Phycisphaerales bacterium]
MKDSSLKFAALALLIVVFAAVAITARWADDSTCSYVNQPTQDTCETATKSDTPSPLNTQVDPGATWAEIASADTRIDRHGSNVDAPQQQWDRSAKKLVSRPDEEQDDGGEPPDNSKHTYGKDDVE